MLLLRLNLKKYAIPADRDYILKNSIDYSDILLLGEIGLIDSGSNIYTNNDL